MWQTFDSLGGGQQSPGMHVPVHSSKTRGGIQTHIRISYSAQSLSGLALLQHESMKHEFEPCSVKLPQQVGVLITMPPCPLIPVKKHKKHNFQRRIEEIDYIAQKCINRLGLRSPLQTTKMAITQKIPLILNISNIFVSNSVFFDVALVA